MKTVSSTSTPVEKMVTPRRGTDTSWTPFQAIRPAPIAWPANFVMASSCHTSSAMPSRQTTPAPSRTPHGWPPWKTLCRKLLEVCWEICSR